jgi:hypothetical protein
MPLLNTTCPGYCYAVPHVRECWHPAPLPRRLGYAESSPGVRVRRMFEHAPVIQDRPQSGLETSLVVAELTLDTSAGASSPVPTPALTWGMSHHWPWPSILPGVALLVPRVYFWEPIVGTVLLDEERGNH